MNALNGMEFLRVEDLSGLCAKIAMDEQSGFVVHVLWPEHGYTTASAD